MNIRDARQPEFSVGRPPVPPALRESQRQARTIIAVIPVEAERRAFLTIVRR